MRFDSGKYNLTELKVKFVPHFWGLPIWPHITPLEFRLSLFFVVVLAPTGSMFHFGSGYLSRKIRFGEVTAKSKIKMVFAVGAKAHLKFY